MTDFSRIIFFIATILCTISLAYCAGPDYSDYLGGSIKCTKDKKIIVLADVVASDAKHLMNVKSYKSEKKVQMYVRIAPISDPVETAAAKKDCNDIKLKIQRVDPETFSFKIGHGVRRAIEVPDDGEGVLSKKDKPTVPCYYCVVQYSDKHLNDFVEYNGGIIEDRNKSLLVTLENNGMTGTNLKVSSFNGTADVLMYARVAPLYDPNEVSEAQADCKQLKGLFAKAKGTKLKAVEVLADGDGVLKKAGKVDVSCYYYISKLPK